MVTSFRRAWRHAYKSKFSAAEPTQTEEAEEAGDHDVELSQAISISVNEAFCDGTNTGFYVNNYTTKPGPGLKALMDPLRGAN